VDRKTAFDEPRRGFFEMCEVPNFNANRSTDQGGAGSSGD
jgi:hypothetical protein